MTYNIIIKFINYVWIFDGRQPLSWKTVQKSTGTLGDALVETPFLLSGDTIHHNHCCRCVVVDRFHYPRENLRHHTPRFRFPLPRGVCPYPDVLSSTNDLTIWWCWLGFSFSMYSRHLSSINIYPHTAVLHPGSLFLSSPTNVLIVCEATLLSMFMC